MTDVRHQHVGMGIGDPASAGRRFFQNRLSGQYEHLVHLIVSIFTGVALGSGAITVLSIFTSAEALRVKFSALALWLATFAAIIARFDGLMVASMIRTACPTVMDVVPPFLIGVTEFNLFAVLAPLPSDPLTGQPSAATQLQRIAWWPVLFAVYMTLATMSIRSARAHLVRTIDQTPTDVHPLMRWYIDRLRQAQRATGTWPVLMLAVFLAVQTGPEVLREWQGALGLLVVCAMVAIIVTQERMRGFIMERLASDTEGDSRPPPTAVDTVGQDPRWIRREEFRRIVVDNQADGDLSPELRRLSPGSHDGPPLP